LLSFIRSLLERITCIIALLPSLRFTYSSPAIPESLLA